MVLAPGKTLADYVIVSHVGSGGMGEVYRARDPKLGRQVAIKVLPETFVQDQERLGRFEREARVLASLSHPNIAAIHGLERSESIRFIVMEFVEGKTLEELIAGKNMPTDEILPIFRQIAEALESAHDKNVIHRDLKPNNIKVTPEGIVKVLDFGLAKASEKALRAADLSQSPTVTMKSTEKGVILGTAPYMSPEQARGKTVDTRTDIWAYGCCLYKALTGKSPFLGETVSDTIAQILEREPNWQLLPETTPPGIRSLLRRCLRKDPNHRLQDIGDARVEIEEAQLELSQPSFTTAEERPKRWKKILAWSLVGLSAVLVAAAIFWTTQRERVPPSIARLAILTPPLAPIQLKGWPSVAISPDGSRLVYVSESEEGTELQVRPMDQTESAPIPETHGATTPFFSPDGRWVGFFAEGKLKKVALSGGAAFAICDAMAGRGASWSSDNTIVFAPSWDSGLFRVSDAGGTPEALTKLDAVREETTHRWPQILPGNKAVLFTARKSKDASFDDADICVFSLETGERKTLIQGGSFARYVPTGHLAYAKLGTMLAAPFDLSTLGVTGTSIPIEQEITYLPGSGVAQFSISDTGTMAFVAGGIPTYNEAVVMIDRQGEVEVILGGRQYGEASFSPDGQHLAVSSLEGANYHIFSYEFATGSLNRLTFEGVNLWPVWTPDSERVVFSSTRAGPRNLFWKPIDGSEVVGRLTTSEHTHIANSCSPDGSVLAFTESHPTMGEDIWLLPLNEDRVPRPFLQTAHDELSAAFSPDGHWIAYASNESGQYEVYVVGYPEPVGKRQISSNGGTAPRWNPTGKEIIYQWGDKFMAASIETEPRFSVGGSELLFTGSSGAACDISPDGTRFVTSMEREQDVKPRDITVVLNWFEELKRLVPTN